MNRESKSSTLYVVEVIPILRGIAKSTLSYFTREDIPVGSFVKITVRSKPIRGLVTRSFDARSAKSSLKGSSFPLKKLTRTSSDARLSPAFIRAAESAAAFYATTVGSILGAVVSKLFLDSPELLPPHFFEAKTELTPREPLLVQLSDEERFTEYKRIVRESLARNASVLLIVPTNEDALRAAGFLSKGIEPYVFTTAGKGPKALKETFKKASAESHPILCITTSSYIAFERPDFETIILDKQNSRAFRTQRRPYIDLRVFIEMLAHESKKSLIFGDSMLSLYSLWREKQATYAELSPLKWRIHHEPKTSLVNMKPAAAENENEEKKFAVFSKELRALIEKALEEKRKIFLFGARKGLAPSTVCRDCGAVLACENCAAPMVLHTNTRGERFYHCHACRATRTSETRCDSCQSWNLLPLGIGIDRIKEEARRLFPDAPIFVLDKEHAPTGPQAAAIAKKFANDKGGIIVGTELALLYLEKIPYLGVVSLDSLFSIPDFGIHERIFYLVTKLLEKCSVEAVIQTRNIGREILGEAVGGDIANFYRREIREREELRYPPFYMFITIRVEGAPIDLEKKLHLLTELFGARQPDFIKSKGSKGPRSGRTTLTMILRLLRKEWPDPSLQEKLLLLTPDFLIKVDPESII